ncbi:hypothetical protein INT48_001639 [Thamnidium elegans]|uniref:Uncharacterized protein n=1 Tax=Thamnidium elegans TaxID=101142 RepID=A0A8H7SRR6_9FUNG|nr:hypothetical protein INT48_001639 [Thamnidium elegans]
MLTVQLAKNELGLKALITETISIVNSSVTDSEVFSAEAGSSVTINKNGKGKRKLNVLENEFDVSVQKNKKVFSFTKPIKPGVNYIINSHRDMPCLNQSVMAHNFLRNSLNQEFGNFLIWICSNGFDSGLSEEENMDILFIRFVLVDCYANCMKPAAPVQINERTPFVEYIVPIFKYFSAVYKTVSLQWCEKGLETIGYSTADLSKVLLMESSSEDNDVHLNEDTVKLLECSIRGLKLETERLPNASFETFKKRRFFTCCYSKDKLTLMSTFLADSEHWGFTKIRDAIVPRSRFGRSSWSKVFELTLFLQPGELGRAKTSF